MRISPIDIQQQTFKTRAFGYDKAGVDHFLEMLAEELERLVRKNQDLQEALDRTNESLKEMKEREETLKQTLITTQKMTEDLKATARREVDVMMAEAEIKAERLMHNAEERRLQLIEEIQEIKRQKVDFEVGLRGLLEKHIRMLDLNAVAIEQKDADSRMLEEPLPFDISAGQPSEKKKKSDRQTLSPAKQFEDADYDNSDTQNDEPQASSATSLKDESHTSDVPELTFELEPDEDDEEDLLK